MSAAALTMCEGANVSHVEQLAWLYFQYSYECMEWSGYLVARDLDIWMREGASIHTWYINGRRKCNMTLVCEYTRLFQVELMNSVQ